MKTFLSILFAAAAMVLASCQTQQPEPQSTRNATFDCLMVFLDTKDSSTLFVLPDVENLEEQEGFEIDPIFPTYFYLSIFNEEQGRRDIQFPESGQIHLENEMCETYFLFAFDTKSTATVQKEITLFLSGDTEAMFTPHMVGVCTGSTPCPIR